MTLNKTHLAKFGIFIAALIVLGLGINLLTLITQRKSIFSFSNNTKISPHILSITQPVNYLKGEVLKKEGNSFSITIPNTKNSIEILNTDETIFTKLSNSILYLSKPNVPVDNSTTISFNDLKIGDSVIVTSKEDLRTITGPIVASAVEILAFPNTVSGNISNLFQNQLTLISNDKIYTIILNNDTEISVLDTTATQQDISSIPAKIYTSSDLYNGLYVTVYTEQNTSITYELLAKRIEPQFTFTP